MMGIPSLTHCDCVCGSQSVRIQHPQMPVAPLDLLSAARSQSICGVCDLIGRWDMTWHLFRAAVLFSSVSCMMCNSRPGSNQTMNLYVSCLFIVLFLCCEWPHVYVCVYYRETVWVALRMALCCQPAVSLNGENREEYRWFLFSKASEVQNTDTENLL